MRLKHLIGGMMLGSCFTVCASDNLVANVSYVGTYGNGDLFINVNRSINQSGCESDRIFVRANHPELTNWLNIATKAYLNNVAIQFRTNGCYMGKPTLDSSDRSWLHFAPK
ncbi:hypothetical protein [Pseudoalteromonas rubra]|uniref:hypothetical protein n=1 Tax=Pseudoalteromonas rubra TaxID=43658 RepID=UPI000F768EF4|nr:hypothetical protein [Pseudoalteromonas rubra]